MSERKTALEGFKLLAIFIGGEAWRAQEVEKETGWTKSKVHGMLASACSAGYLDRVREGLELRYQLSESLRASLTRGAGRATERETESVIRLRSDEAIRALRTQMEHLGNELREILK